MAIQILLIVAVILGVVFTLRALRGEKQLAIKRLAALAFALLAIVSILFPGLISKIANFLGVGRGTDLLLYLFIIAAVLFGGAVIRAKARSDARVTKLARAMALSEANKRYQSK
ncbi:DUF2304 domain-containing protein [Canibacter zhoujuaniae]|uniref:DUF2304 domain-containing protein n=1 Tax=Canibacter zhoujuaniae TaxID=2708343 RepID=UPI0014221748|nr:DUF2304 domain-containing protein [Canibacter zhoujuaniae]